MNQNKREKKIQLLILVPINSNTLCIPHVCDDIINSKVITKATINPWCFSRSRPWEAEQSISDHILPLSGGNDP